MDRFKVRDDLQLRLAESFETVLNLSNGTAKVAFMDEPNAEEIIFSANFACPHCGYSMSELEPRMFSFNNPAGACQTCDGLGTRQFFDPQRVMHNGDTQSCWRCDSRLGQAKFLLLPDATVGGGTL